MCACVGCQLNSDQALRLICLKGHVRARGLTLRAKPVDKKQEIFCVLKHFFFEGVRQQKNRQPPPEMLFPTRYWCQVLKISRLVAVFLEPQLLIKVGLGEIMLFIGKKPRERSIITSGGVGYFSNERGFWVEFSLQRISWNLSLWKRNASSVVL